MLALIIGVGVMLTLFFFNQIVTIRNRYHYPKFISGSQTNKSRDSETPITDVLGVQNDIASQTKEFKTKLYNLINAYRKENNLSPLVVYPPLELSANYKLQDMISRNYWKHQDVQSRPPWQFFEQAGYNYKKAGENLGFNQKSAFSVFAAWTKSLKHKEQLLNPDYEHMGLAVDCQTLKKADPDAGCIVVLHLGRL